MFWSVFHSDLVCFVFNQCRTCQSHAKSETLKTLVMTNCHLRTEELALPKTPNHLVRHRLQAPLFRRRGCHLPLPVVGRKLSTRCTSLTGTLWIMKCLGLFVNGHVCVRCVHCSVLKQERKKQAGSKRFSGPAKEDTSRPEHPCSCLGNGTECTDSTSAASRERGKAV